MATRWPRLKAALKARRQGATLRQAAAAAGVHVATLCRWAGQDGVVSYLLRLAKLEARAEARRRRRFEVVEWTAVPRLDRCPACGGVLEVRAVGPGYRSVVRFWRCTGCPFQSWRPRCPWDCPACGGPRFWSHSRKSIVCGACGARTRGH
jgi:hypothetical protein